MLLLFAALLCGCNLTSTSTAPTGVPTATTVQVALVGSPIPTLDPDGVTDTPTPEVATQPPAETEAAVAVATEGTPAAPTSGEQETTMAAASGCGVYDEDDGTAHRVSATIDYTAKTIDVTQETLYINRGDEALSDLVFNVEPNYWLDAFRLISVEGAAETSLTGRRLTLRLAAPLEPECGLTVTLRFALNVPAVGGGISSFKGYFGYTDEQMNLGHWLPTVAVRANNQWITRESFFAGEQTVLDIADWDVTWILENAENVSVAAPGDVETLSETEGRGTLRRARDYSISLSDIFVVHRDITVTGVPVELYTLGSTEVTTANGQVVDGASFALTMAMRSLELFTETFGPYIYPRVVIVEGDFPDGMEFSGFMFVSRTWFDRYDGTPQGYLMLITVHEVAHQWWYARVGSDSALTPWLDEALATYGEFLVLERFYPNLTAWWWEFRVTSYAPTGFVDSTVYEFTTLREYINAVYLNGVRMLHQIRIDLGEGVFFDLLRRYAEAYAGQVVGSQAFWSLLTPEQLAATRATRALYLRRADF